MLRTIKDNPALKLSGVSEEASIAMMVSTCRALTRRGWRGRTSPSSPPSTRPRKACDASGKALSDEESEVNGFG